MIFHESGLQFTFGPNWVVKKYDEHAYFRGLSGRGLKGVDFIAIRDENELVLIEVKNYRTRYNATIDRSFDVVVKPVQELAFELKRKAEDTVLAIDAVLQFYHRRWWYRRFRKMWMRWPWLQHRRAFWTRAEILSHQSLHYVIWLALDADDPKGYAAKLLMELEKIGIENIDKISVTNGESSPFGDEIKLQ